MNTIRDLEIEATVAEVPVRALLMAIRDFGDELQAWLHRESPVDNQKGFLGVTDARLLDFTPLDAYGRIVSICSEAERRAEAALKRHTA